MAGDALSFLAETPVRARLLGVLDAEGPARPRTLRDALDVSRATIHRNLSALVDRGWVRQTDEGYEATTAGVLVHERYGSFRTALDVVDRFEELLEVLPESGVPPLSVLGTATLVSTSPDDPHAPVMHYVQELTASTTSRVRGLSPVRSEMFAQGHEELLEAGVETELLVPERVIERVDGDETSELQAALELPNLEISILEMDPGFGLTVLDDRAFLGGYDAENQLRVLAVSTDEVFVDWAARTYEDVAATATRITGQRGSSGGTGEDE